MFTSRLSPKRRASFIAASAAVWPGVLPTGPRRGRASAAIRLGAAARLPPPSEYPRTRSVDLLAEQDVQAFAQAVAKRPWRDAEGIGELLDGQHRVSRPLSLRRKARGIDRRDARRGMPV